MLTPEAKEKLYKEMKTLTNFSSEDVTNLASLSSVMKQYSQPLTEKFYGHLHNLETTKTILQEETGRTQKLKSTLINWFENLFAGQWNYSKIWQRNQLRLRWIRTPLPNRLVWSCKSTKNLSLVS